MTDETQEQQITAVGNEMSASFLAAKKRSDETLAAIEKNPGKFTMLTGDRPSAHGPLLRHAAQPRGDAEQGRAHQHHHRRLSGDHRP